MAPPGAPAAWLFTGLIGELTPTPSTFDATLNGQSGWIVAALDYELGYALEPAAAPAGWNPDPALPLARLWRFANCQTMTAAEVENWLCGQLATLDADACYVGVGGITSTTDAETYRQAVEKIQNLIAAGDCYQVNYTYPLHFTWFGDPLALYAALRQRQPVRYGGIVVTEDGALLSLSPELFLERRGNKLITRPMKGTAPRHSDPALLQSSEKNRAENLMIVDLLRNDLGRVAETGSVTVESLFEIEDYPTLWQMVSQVSADVAEASPAEILRALFPCGSVTGAPKIRAMQIIGELEAAPRGLYTGAFGWLAPNGDFRLNVAIRTLELGSDHQGKMGIGSGIVSDSDADEEWRECQMKAAFLAGLDPGFQLIETLRRIDGTYPQLDSHLARLAASAHWLGFTCNRESIEALLAEQPETGEWRVRLTLSKTGGIKASATPLIPEALTNRNARLAKTAIDSRHPLRRHKTTVRSQYDAALQDIAHDPQIFDVIFCNERGEIAEGARSTVFVERGGILLTPPLESGALPGVLRAQLLTQGKAREAVLYPADLVAGCWLGNAVRGLVPVHLLE
ncbi:MAG: pabB [Proteobacteria bacterium]|nr:pabB [Pseudomonadota bacterium]